MTAPLRLIRRLSFRLRMAAERHRLYREYPRLRNIDKAIARARRRHGRVEYLIARRKEYMTGALKQEMGT